MAFEKVVLIVGTRPNFMKAAPLYNELVARKEYDVTLVHTGQHYDYNMSDIFFQQLGLSDAKIVFLIYIRLRNNLEVHTGDGV